MQNKNLHVEIIGYDSGWGCRNYKCEDGPDGVAADAILHALRQNDIPADWRGALGLKFLGNHEELTGKEDTLPQVLEGLRRLAQRVSAAVRGGHVPIVIGGDHASAIGTWSGTVAGSDSFEQFGLVWLDAHLDAHTYETSYQGKWGGWWHGQPVTALTGNGLPAFTSLCGARRKISPAHLSIIGPHSFEPAEEAYARENGIRVYYLDEVERRGFKAVFDEALTRATDGTKGFGLSIDLDAFRPEDAPGVGTAEDKGLVAAEVLPIIKNIGHNSLFRALEIAEFNPHNDIGGKTRDLVTLLVESIFSNSII
jgi:arginase